MGIYHIGYSTDAPPVQQGATYTLNFTAYTGTSTGSAFNFTGYSLRSKVRQRYNSTAVTATFTCTILSSTAGTGRLTLSSTVTAALSEGGYVYDVEAYTTGLVVSRILEGKLLVTPEVTY